MASTLITPPPEKNLNRNPVFVTLESDQFDGDPGAYIPTVDNLECVCEVYKIVPPATQTFLGRAVGPYSSIDKRISFNIADFLLRDTALPPATSLMVQASPVWAEAVGLAFQFLIKHADKYGDPVATDELYISDTYLSVNGGLPADARQSINWAGSLIPLHSYFYKRNSSFPFYKPVSRTQPDYIYFVSLVTDDIEVTVTRHYSDGTTDTFISHTMEVEANKGYYTQCGYAHLKVETDAAPGKDIVGYDVSLVRVTGPVNAYTAFFVIDDMCPSWEKYILYHNGFGGYETVRMKGVTVYSHQTTSETFERTRWIDFTIQSGSMDDLRTYGSPVFNTHTGHYPSFYIEHLRQLLHAKMWLIDMELSWEFILKKIIRTTTQAEIRSDIPSANGMAITYRPAWDDDGYNVF